MYFVEIMYIENKHNKIKARTMIRKRMKSEEKTHRFADYVIYMGYFGNLKNIIMLSVIPFVIPLY